ncbi:MAG: type 4a pilus biogenesis protein PilO [Candidatus Omnitrophota bacterium]
MSLINMQLDNQKKILIVIFFVLIAYVESNFILKAQRAGLSRLDVKIVKLNTDLLNLNRGLEEMRTSKSKFALPGQKEITRSSRILLESQVSELLQEISNVANKFNIKISQIRPIRQAQKEKSAIGQDKLSLVLINLDLVCDYHNLGRFIQALENSSVFMGVQGLDISTQLPDYLKQKVKLVLKTYVTK